MTSPATLSMRASITIACGHASHATPATAPCEASRISDQYFVTIKFLFCKRIFLAYHVVHILFYNPRRWTFIVRGLSKVHHSVTMTLDIIKDFIRSIEGVMNQV